MTKLIHNIALLAGLVALAVGLWQDWEIWFTLKRMLISYLGFFFFGSFLAISVLAIPLLEGKPDTPAGRMAADKRAGTRTETPRPNFPDGMETANETTSHITRKVGQ